MKIAITPRFFENNLEKNEFGKSNKLYQLFFSSNSIR